MPLSFKEFLLNEDKAYLNHQIGDVLTSMQDLQTDMDGMGLRHIAKVAEDIVDSIRKILHSSWSPKVRGHLIELQKIGVALMKSVEEKNTLKEDIPNLVQSLEQLAGKMGGKVNNLNASPQDAGQEVDQAAMPETPPPQPPPGQQTPPPQGQQPGQPPALPPGPPQI
jgi:hypothetical protein